MGGFEIKARLQPHKLALARETCAMKRNLIALSCGCVMTLTIINQISVRRVRTRLKRLKKRLKKPYNKVISDFIIWLAPRAAKMTQFARSDWLPERARRSHPASSGLPAVSRKNNIKSLLTKSFRSRWLDIGLVFFFASLWTSSRYINTQKNNNLANIQPT